MLKTKSLRWNGSFAAMLGALGLMGPLLAGARHDDTRFDNSDTVADDGSCSLREAIAAANTDKPSGASAGECPKGDGSDTITVPAMEISLEADSRSARRWRWSVVASGARSSMEAADETRSSWWPPTRSRSEASPFEGARRSLAAVFSSIPAARSRSAMRRS